MLLLLLACKGDAPSGAAPNLPATAERTVQSCAQYDAGSELHGFCLGRQVLALSNPADAVTVCEQAGQWADGCRAAWVEEQERRQRPLTLEQLLLVCGPNQDCAFRVLDTHATGDVFHQMAQCDKYVTKYLGDCIGHTLYRWAAENPDPESATKLLADTTHDPEVVGQFVAAAAACRSVGTCGVGDSKLEATCRAALEGYKRAPGRCPVAPKRNPGIQTPEPLHGQDVPPPPGVERPGAQSPTDAGPVQTPEPLHGQDVGRGGVHVGGTPGPEPSSTPKG